MQFIPSTWQRYGVDGGGDGIANPNNLHDAIHAAARYLCANGGGVAETLRTAVLAYNHADWYADEVLSLAERYAQPAAATGSQIVGDYALPVARDLLNVSLLRRPHHDYPAWDLAVPTGTPVYATHRGTVIAVTNDGRCGRGLVIAGLDGARYTYCHADAVTVARGQGVAAGAEIMRSGNTGRSTGPHLHLQIHSPAGALVCPQPLLEAWYLGRSDAPATAPTTGCTS
jgi:murein DD-endopeptidase MepM/ murein hydrolase activator NlpD